MLTERYVELENLTSFAVKLSQFCKWIIQSSFVKAKDVKIFSE